MGCCLAGAGVHRVRDRGGVAAAIRIGRSEVWLQVAPRSGWIQIRGWSDEDLKRI